MITANEAKKITNEVLVERELTKVARTHAWADSWLSEGIKEAATKGFSNFVITIHDDISLAHLEVILYQKGFSTERLARSGDKTIRISW